MQFDSFAEFLNMGGHALYVWLAYGATIVILALNYVVSSTNHKNTLKHMALQAQLSAKADSSNSVKTSEVQE